MLELLLTEKDPLDQIYLNMWVKNAAKMTGMFIFFLTRALVIPSTSM